MSVMADLIDGLYGQSDIQMVHSKAIEIIEPINVHILTISDQYILCHIEISCEVHYT